MTGTISWSVTDSWWVVTDEYGNEWFALDVDGPHALLQREDSQQFYGATWCADGDASTGTIYLCQEDEVRQGVNEEYCFGPGHGWVEVV